MEKEISFIIVNYNNSELTAECVFSIEAHLKGGCNTEILIIENGSKQEEVQYLKNCAFPPHVEIIYSSVNLGFGAGNNLARDRVTGKYVVYLNNDTIIIDDSIKYGIALLEERQDIGMVGAKLLHPDLSPNLSYGSFPFLKICIVELFNQIPISYFKQSRASIPPKDQKQPFEIDFPCGAFMMLRYRDFKMLSGFDETFFMYFEETDMAYRLKKEFNMKIVCHPKITLIHKTGSTTVLNDDVNREYYYKSWRKFILKYRNAITLKLVKLVLFFIVIKSIFLSCLKLNYKSVRFLKRDVKLIIKCM